MNNEVKFEDTLLYPVLALRGLPVFPNSLVHFDVGRDISVQAIEKAMSRDKKILILAQVDPDIEQPQEEDLYTTGTICYIKQVLRISDNNIRVLIEGIKRATVIDFIRKTPYFECTASEINDVVDYDENKVVMEAYVRELKRFSAEYFSLVGRLPEETDVSFAKEKDPIFSNRTIFLGDSTTHITSLFLPLSEHISQISSSVKLLHILHLFIFVFTSIKDSENNLICSSFISIMDNAMRSADFSPTLGNFLKHSIKFRNDLGYVAIKTTLASLVYIYLTFLLYLYRFFYSHRL